MNIWTGLLFLEGAIADAPLARELVAEPAQDVAPRAPGRQDELPAARGTLDRLFTAIGLH